MTGHDGAAGYCYGEHTADVLVHAWGASAAEAIGQVILATAAMVIDPAVVSPPDALWVYAVEADDWVGCMVKSVNEFLFLHDSDGALVHRVTVDALPAVAGAPVRVKVHIQGQRGAERSNLAGIRAPAKAATYHLATLTHEPTANRWVARLLLDV
jgi:SHS2 domain-containing protein